MRRDRDSRVRKGRQLLSLLEVLAFAVATLVLLPVVVEADPDDPISFQAPGDRSVGCGFTDEVLVGTTTSCRLHVANASTSDVSLFMFVDAASIRVTRCEDGESEPGADGGCVGDAARVEVARSDPDFERFVDAWAISAHSAGSVVCEPRGSDAYDGGAYRDDTSRMCSMGVVGGARPSAEAPAVRRYEIGMTLRDDGTDQTRFGGWDLHFDFVVRAIV